MKHNVMHASFMAVAAVTALAVGAANADAAVYSSSAPYASYSTGGYTLYNDEWGSGHGTQTLWVNSASNWGVYSTQPATNGVKSYPNASKPVGKALNSVSYAGASFNESLPGFGQFESAFDIWLNDYNIEIMIWTDTQGVGPAGSPVGTVSLDGANWTLYSGNVGHPVYSFVRSGNTTSGTVSILPFLTYLQNTKHYYWNPTLSYIQYGFEITSTNNTGENFVINSYSAWAG